MAHPRAGLPAEPADLVNVPRLLAAYYTERPDPGERAHRVAFGTSGHRGSSFRCSFNEAHILAITQAICEYRAGQGVGGPLFLGQDTHALSEPAFMTALEMTGWVSVVFEPAMMNASARRMSGVEALGALLPTDMARPTADAMWHSRAQWSMLLVPSAMRTKR